MTKVFVGVIVLLSSSCYMTSKTGGFHGLSRPGSVSWTSCRNGSADFVCLGIGNAGNQEVSTTKQGCFLTSDCLLSISIRSNKSSKFDDGFMGKAQIQFKLKPITEITDLKDKAVLLKFSRHIPKLETDLTAVSIDNLLIRMMFNSSLKQNLRNTFGIVCFASFIPKEVYETILKMMNRESGKAVIAAEKKDLFGKVIDDLNRFQTNPPNVKHLECLFTEDHSRIVINFLLNTEWKASHLIDLSKDRVFLSLVEYDFSDNLNNTNLTMIQHLQSANATLFINIRRTFTKIPRIAQPSSYFSVIVLLVIVGILTVVLLSCLLQLLFQTFCPSEIDGEIVSEYDNEGAQTFNYEDDPGDENYKYSQTLVYRNVSVNSSE
jgi:hypothetical protein